MNEIVTFFRDEQDKGEIYLFPYPDAVDHYCHVYSRNPFKDKKIKQFFNERSIPEALGKYGGGLLVDAAQEKSTLLVKIAIIPDYDQEYFPPDFIVSLKPGSSPSKEKFDNSKLSLELPLGSHLIIPVDREAGNHFKEFHNYLRWFPTDLESLVLNTIRQPAFDLRLDRVEKELGINQRVLPTLSKRNWFATGKHFLFEPANWLKIFELLLLITAAAGGGVYLISNIGQSTPVVAEQSCLPCPECPKPGEYSSVVTTTPDEIDNAVVKLCNLLKVPALQNKIRGLDKLWETHFRKPVSYLEVEGVLDPKQATHLFLNDAFLLGIIKLQALNLPSRGESLNFVDDPLKYQSVKTFFEPKLLQLQQEQKDMLAYLVCRLSDSPQGKAFLMKDNSETIFQQGVPCEKMTTDKLLPGLTELNKSLQEQLK